MKNKPTNKGVDMKVKKQLMNRFELWLVRRLAQLACGHKKKFTKGKEEICWACGYRWKVK